MRSSLYAGIAAWGLAVVSSAALAADAQGRFAGHGPGIAQCSQLIDALQVEGPDRPLFVGWVSGFLTAANAYKPDTYDVSPWQPMEFVANVVADQCSRNPNAAVTEVMLAVTEQLAMDRLQQSSQVLTLEHGGNRVAVYREVLRRAQARLSELGYYGGSVDGAYGPQTRGALESFQQNRGLQATGLPDDGTLLALFYDLVPQRPGGG